MRHLSKFIPYKLPKQTHTVLLFIQNLKFKDFKDRFVETRFSSFQTYSHGIGICHGLWILL